MSNVLPSPKPYDAEMAKYLAGTAAALATWVVAYRQLVPFSEWMVAQLPVERHSRLGEAVAFFIYDTPKVLLLLSLVVFAMGIVRSFFSPEKTRAVLAGKSEGAANVLAAGLGVLTPFCSCSAVSLFIGFVSAGVPLGVTFSFLIAAPMVNEVALGLLFALVGWKVAATYLAFGLTVAILVGYVIGRMKLEGWLEEWVRNVRAGAADVPDQRLTVVDRIRAGLDAVKDIVGRVWLWMIAGIAAGALIHGYVPADLMARIMGADAWWSVPAAVIIGIPMYSNAAGIIPVVEALLGKGAALGTTLAFNVMLSAFGAAAIGGFESYPRTMIASFVITLSQQYLIGYLSPAYGEAYPLVIVLAALVLRPNGLLGVRLAPEAR